MRRYTGFYASVIQSKVRKARGNKIPEAINEGRPVKPKWAAMIAKIFGDMPLACPRCGATMQLAEFILDAAPIAKLFPDVARAPPSVQFDRYVRPEGDFVYGCTEYGTADANFNQLPPDNDAFFNQEIAW